MVKEFDIIMKNHIIERLNKLRNAMKSNGIDAYYIPSDDFHGSEFVSEYFKNRELFKAFLLKVPIIDDFSEENLDVKDFYKEDLEDDKLIRDSDNVNLGQITNLNKKQISEEPD